MNKPQRSKSVRPVRIRVKRLDEIDETKLALALWLMVSPRLEDAEEAGPGLPRGDRSGKEAA